MRVVLITDTHWGVRSDSAIFLDYQKKFIDNILLPYIDNNKIDTVIHLGDLVDRRKYINYVTAERMKNDFLKPLDLRAVDTHIIAGNHDIYHKNTNEVNALRELVAGKYNNIRVYTNPTEVTIGDLPILFVPWIVPETRQLTIDRINHTSAEVCFGHLELNGFEMDKGSVCTTGEDKKIFERFDIVCSGHFHHKNTIDGIYYLGAPYQMTWADYNDTKGFHVFDTETRGLQFIENPYTLFNIVYYNDVKYKLDQMVEQANKLSIEQSYTKIIVDQKSKPYQFDRFVTLIEQKQPHDLKVVDRVALIIDNTSIIDQAEDTLTILTRSLDEAEISVDKDAAKALLKQLYNQANMMDL
jgi:DNA repair exonuclease SbcCD nuclease subunit